MFREALLKHNSIIYKGRKVDTDTHTGRTSEEAEGRKAVFVQAKGHLRLTINHKKLGREEQGKSSRSHVSKFLVLQLTLLVTYPGFEELLTS